MSKKEMTLQEKAEAQIAAESKAKLEQTMAKIAAEEAQAKADAEQAIIDAKNKEEQRLKALYIKSQQLANSALLQTSKLLAHHSNIKHQEAWVKARDNFNKAMIKAGYDHPTLNLIK